MGFEPIVRHFQVLRVCSCWEWLPVIWCLSTSCLSHIHVKPTNPPRPVQILSSRRCSGPFIVIRWQISWHFIWHPTPQSFFPTTWASPPLDRIHLLRDSCGCRSHVLCRYCGSSCSFRVYHILHRASRTVRHPFDHLPEHRRVVRQSPSNCTGYDLSPPYVGNYVQLDEFTPKDVGLSWHPHTLHTWLWQPLWRRQQRSARIGSCLSFYYLVQPLIICHYSGRMLQTGFWWNGF